ncbi:hypothetical protein QEN19_002194 [Hanseniaspora menglaensis]
MSAFLTSFMESQLEGSAEDYAMDKFNVFANKKYNTKNPFRDVETNKRLKLPEELHPEKSDIKFWKSCQNKAWRDDQCFLSMCGFYMSGGCCAIGTCPLIVLIPVIGPIFMYYIHSKLIKKCQEKRPGLLSDTEVAKMYANIVFDLCISLPPIIGTFFTWMNGCSTRNCTIIYAGLCKQLQQKIVNENHQLKNSSPNVQNSSTQK